MKRLYAVLLSKTSYPTARLALYEVTEEGRLNLIWHYEEKGKPLLPCQVYSPRKESGPDLYPAYHFKITNIGYNKLQYLTEQLKPIFGDDLEILSLNGWAPSANLGR